MTVRKFFSYLALFFVIMLVAKMLGRYIGTQAGYNEIYKNILNESKKLNIPSSFEAVIEQQAPFFRVVAKGEIEQIKSELKNLKIDINSRTSAGHTPLMYAAMFNQNPDVIDVLIKTGADISAISAIGENALMLSCQFNQSEKVIRRLLRKGLDVNSKTVENGKTPLMYAANFNKNVEVIKLLIEAGGDVTAQATGGLFKGYNPLMFACKIFAGRDPQKLKILLDAGSDIDAQNAFGETALIIATKSESYNSELIRFLLESGADASIRDNDNMTAEDYAEMEKTRKIFKEFGR